MTIRSDKVESQAGAAKFGTADEGFELLSFSYIISQSVHLQGHLMLKRNLCLILISTAVLTSCSGQSSGEAQGYIEGRYTYIATSVSGVLTELMVARGMQVKQGQPLFALEAQPESDEYQAAQENLQQMIAARDATAANLVYAKITYERNKILVPKKAIQQSELDRSKATYDANIAQLAQANATIESAKATLAQSKWTLGQKTISAPVDAVVFDTYYRIGERTEADQAILSLLAPANIKAIFYVSEAVLGGIKLNDKVSVHCDGCKKAYEGTIDFISPSAEYTPPVIYSNETNEKLVYRIEAAFSPQDAVNLHPGQPVNVTYFSHG